MSYKIGLSSFTRSKALILWKCFSPKSEYKNGCGTSSVSQSLFFKNLLSLFWQTIQGDSFDHNETYSCVRFTRIFGYKIYLIKAPLSQLRTFKSMGRIN